MKYLIQLISFAVLLPVTVSCQQECIYTAKDPMSVEFQISLPDVPQTRSESETILKWTVFEIKDGVPKKLVNSDEQPVIVTDEDTTVPITLELMQGHKYQVAFAVTNSANSFATFQDGVVTVNYEGVSSNSDADDIFVGKSDVLTVTGDYTEAEAIELHRPFAQLNWSTSDLSHKQVGRHINELTATVTVSGDIYRTLDIIDNSFDGKVEDGLTFGDVALSGAATPLTEEDAYSNLTTNYLLIKDGEEQQTLDCAIHFDGHTDVTVNVNNASAKPNYRTNIFGALLTNEKSVTVTMEKGFANNKYTGISENDVIENILAGDYVIEEGKTVDLRRYKNIPLRAGQKLTVNGEIIINNNTFIISDNTAPTSICGDGSIKIIGIANKAFTIENGAELEINDVTIVKEDISAGSEYIILIKGGTMRGNNITMNIESGAINTTYRSNSYVFLNNCRITTKQYSKGYSINLESNGNILLENCTVKTIKQNLIAGSNSCVTIKGGNSLYEVSDYNASNIHSSYFGNKIIIETGKFWTTYQPNFSCSYYAGPDFVFQGGYFNRYPYDKDHWKDSWISEGYELITNSTAVSGYPYEVRKKEEVTE